MVVSSRIATFSLTFGKQKLYHLTRRFTRTTTIVSAFSLCENVHISKLLKVDYDLFPLNCSWDNFLVEKV